MKLTLGKSLYDAMVDAARRAAPLEACGLLGGSGGQATEFYELTNADASGEHYSMIPEEQFAAVKDMRTRGIGMLAIWHSHPATPARMSEEDLRLAYTLDVVYAILSLAEPDNPEIRGYAVQKGKCVQVDIEIIRLSPAGRSEAT